jgi:hypothetical protein
MKINTRKIKIMSFTRKSNIIYVNFCLNDISISRIDCKKDIGIM